MANKTVGTGVVVNYDDDTISGLLDGETLTINGGPVTAHAAALAQDGSDASAVTGARLIQLIDAGCKA